MKLSPNKLKISTYLLLIGTATPHTQDMPVLCMWSIVLESVHLKYS